MSNGTSANAVGSLGGAAAIPGSMDAAETEARKLGRTLGDAIRAKRAYRDQDATHREIRNRFKHLVTMNRDGWSHEYSHWLKMGWL